MVAAILPRTLAYKDQAIHNYDCLLTIDKSIYIDWVIIMSFYTALHYVSAHAIQNGVNLQPQRSDRYSPHRKRSRYVRKYINSKFTDYERLFQECNSARYDPMYFSRFKGNVNDLISIANDFKTII